MTSKTWFGLVGGVFAIVLTAGVAQAVAPEISSSSIGDPQTVGPSGTKPSLAVDKNGNPHIVANGSYYAYFYDRNSAGAWTSHTIDMHPITVPPGRPASYNSGTFNNPHIEIDSDDTAWYSGVLFGWTVGMGLFVRDDISTDFSRPTHFSWYNVMPSGWPVGEGSLDPNRPGEFILSGSVGYWQKLTYSATESDRVNPGPVGNQLFAYNGGEKNAIWISKAGNITHPAAATSMGWQQSQAVWHGATDTGYNNSLRQSAGFNYVNWLSWATYSGQGAGDDGAYIDVSSDQGEPATAYMTIGIATGVRLQIWRGNLDGTGSLNFPNNALLNIDPTGGSGLRRFAPQLAPAKDTGCWITWTGSDGYIYIQYIPPTATSLADCGTKTRICPGAISAIHTDSDGNIHMAYLSGGIKYRKISTTFVSSADPLPGDFDGDGAHDLAVYDAATGNWWAKEATASGNGPVLIRGRNWGGWSTVVPVPGNYHGETNSADEIAVFDTVSANWFTRSHVPDVSPQQWGTPGFTPVPNDYDGDGMTDLAVFDGELGQWWIWSFTKGDILISNNTWGHKGTTPVPADYDGDGICDLGIYDPRTYKWHIRRVDGSIIVQDLWWGYGGTIPVPLNYDDDPEFELGAYDPSSGNWHIINADQTEPKVGINWGFPGARPAPANYDGDRNNKWELGVFNPASGDWYIRGLNNVTPDNWGWNGSSVVPMGAH